MSMLAPTLPNAGPSRRALALLALVVLIAHTLVLTTVPARFDSERPPSSEATLAFVTRSIPPPKPAEPPPAALPEAAPVPKPARKKPTEDVSDAEPVRVPKPRPADYVPDAPSPADLLAAAAATPETPAASAPEAAPPAIAPAVALPASVLLEYKMTGNSKGMNYFANAELRWQGRFLFPALLQTEHFFLLTERPGDGGVTRVVQGQNFSGFLLRFAGNALTLSARGSVYLNQALKKRAESRGVVRREA